MTLEQLANTENEIYSTVLDLYKMEKSDELNVNLKILFASYKQVHKNYSDLAKQNDEALKRGLFIQWYAIMEPGYLTGIQELGEEAEENIINLVEEKIQNNSLDNELSWMLNYYANWEFVFNRFKNRKGIEKLIANKIEGLTIGFVIDNETMNKRGQMGRYWNSINHLD